MSILGRHTSRRSRRGLSLLEVLVVIAIMALLAGSVGFALFRVQAQAKIDHARSEGLALRQASIAAMALMDASECPTFESLVKSQVVDEGSRRVDPWGSKWTITCAEARVVVRSPGPDRVLATADDVVVPP